MDFTVTPAFDKITIKIDRVYVREHINQTYTNSLSFEENSSKWRRNYPDESLSKYYYFRIYRKHSKKDQYTVSKTYEK